MNDVTVTSLSASLQNMTYAARDCLYQIALNRKLSHIIFAQISENRKLSRKFKKWCKFSSGVKAKSRKKSSAKGDLSVYGTFLLSYAVDEVG